MTRIKSVPGSASWSRLSDVPARIESTGVPDSPSSGATSSRTMGLTASMTRSDWSTRGRFPSTASPPTSSASRWAFAWSASANSIASGAPGSPRAAAQPRASPPPMFPAPTNPTFIGRTLFGDRVTLALVEEAALEDAGLLLGGDLDVLGSEQEDSLRDPLHAPAERVGHAGREVDQALGELAVRRLKVDDHRLRALELVGDLLGVVEASRRDHVERSDLSAVADGHRLGRPGPAAAARRRRRLLLHRAAATAAWRRSVLAKDVVHVLLAGPASRRKRPGCLTRRR